MFELKQKEKSVARANLAAVWAQGDRFCPNFDDYSIMVASHGSYGSFDFEIRMCSVNIDLNAVEWWGGPTQ